MCQPTNTMPTVSLTTSPLWLVPLANLSNSICLQTAGNSATTLANSCDAAALTYACVCSNGLSPNVTEYSQTLPFYLCQEWGTQCVANCNGNNQCQSSCRSDHPCGAQNPVRVNSSTISSTMSQTASGSSLPAGATTGSQGTIFTGLAGASSTGSSASAGGAPSVRVAALMAGQTFGFLGVAGAVCGVLAFVL